MTTDRFVLDMCITNCYGSNHDDVQYCPTRIYGNFMTDNNVIQEMLTFLEYIISPLFFKGFESARFSFYNFSVHMLGVVVLFSFIHY